jgi:hypothetical protein
VPGGGKPPSVKARHARSACFLRQLLIPVGFRKSEPQQKDHHKANTSTGRAVHQDSRKIANGASTIGESDHGGSNTIARVHTCTPAGCSTPRATPFWCRALGRPRWNTSCAHPAPSSASLLHPSAAATPADATRLRPGSAQGVGIAVLGAAAVLPRRQQRRGGTSLLWPRPRPSAGEPPSSSRVGDPSTPVSALILP